MIGQWLTSYWIGEKYPRQQWQPLSPKQPFGQMWNPEIPVTLFQVLQSGGNVTFAYSLRELTHLFVFLNTWARKLLFLMQNTRQKQPFWMKIKTISGEGSRSRRERVDSEDARLLTFLVLFLTYLHFLESPFSGTAHVHIYFTFYLLCEMIWDTKIQKKNQISNQQNRIIVRKVVRSSQKVGNTIGFALAREESWFVVLFRPYHSLHFFLFFVLFPHPLGFYLGLSVKSYSK